MFHYSSYWFSWSRQLGKIAGDTVEVNLLDLALPHKEKNAAVWIRRHGTAPFRGDKTVKELPAGVMLEMQKLYGQEVTNRLLTEDFLAQIDWEKYRKVCNGGASLESCKKD